MEANELRIGNLTQQGEVIRIQEVSARVNYQLEGQNKISYVDYDNLEPIPLTEDCLLNLSFYEYKTFYWVHGMYRVNAMSDGTWYFGYKDNPLNIVELHYVHQLQNLYFALAGQELTIKEPAV